MNCPNHLDRKAHMIGPVPHRVHNRNIQYPQVQTADYNNCHIPHRKALHMVLHMKDNRRRHQAWAVILKEEPGVAGGTWLRREASLEPLR